LGQRVTHAEVGGFMSTVTEKLNNIGQRVDHLEKTYEYRIKEIEGDLSEERRLKRQIIIALLGSVVTALVSILIALFSYERESLTPSIPKSRTGSHQAVSRR